MKKKKLILLICIIAMMLLVSCGSKQQEGASSEGVQNTEQSTENTEETSSTEVVTPETPSTEDATPSETPTPQPSETPEPEKPAYTFTELNKTMYAKSSVNVRSSPLADGEKVGSLSKGQEVKVSGQCNETGWYRIDLNGTTAYVSNKYLVDTKPVEETPAPQPQPDSGNVENGDTNIQEDNKTTTVNGYVVETGPGYEHDKALAEAGLYTPVWDAETGRYFMLIKRTDDTWHWETMLCDYIIERGGIPGAGGGNNSSISLNGERLYQIYVWVEEPEEPNNIPFGDIVE